MQSLVLGDDVVFCNEDDYEMMKMKMMIMIMRKKQPWDLSPPCMKYVPSLVRTLRRSSFGPSNRSDDLIITMMMMMMMMITNITQYC